MTQFVEPSDLSIELENADLDHVDTLIPKCKPNQVIVKERATKEFSIIEAGAWNDIVDRGDRMKFKFYYKS